MKKHYYSKLAGNDSTFCSSCQDHHCEFHQNMWDRHVLKCFGHLMFFLIPKSYDILTRDAQNNKCIFLVCGIENLPCSEYTFD